MKIGVLLLSGICVLAIVFGVAVLGGLTRIGDANVLDGPRAHDFGEVIVPGTTAVEVSETLRWKNGSGEVLELIRVSSTCGCLVADPVQRSYGPGEEIAVPVTLRLTGSGIEQQSIRLDFANGMSHHILVQATGKRLHDLEFVTSIVRVESEPVEVIAYYLDYTSDDHPGAAEWSGDTDRFSVVLVADWELISARDAATGQPARWQASWRVGILPDAPSRRSGRLHLNVGESSATLRVHQSMPE